MKTIFSILLAAVLCQGCLMYPLSQPSSMRCAVTVNGIEVPLTCFDAWWANVKAHPYAAATEAVTELTALYAIGKAAYDKYGPQKSSDTTTPATGNTYNYYNYGTINK